MTDPRIAALAEALHAARVGCMEPAAEAVCRPDDQRYAGFHPAHAAAILAALPPDWCGHEAEIADLYDRLADEGYKDGIRLAKAVNEVVLHQRGSIEEAWRYGDEQRAITIKQGRELIAAEAEIARLRRIEEAARAVIESQTVITAGGMMTASAADGSALFALRAALEDR